MAREVLQGTHPTIEAAEIRAAVDAVLEHAPDELNALLRVLDETAPIRASFIRDLYGLPPHAFAPHRVPSGDPTRED